MAVDRILVGMHKALESFRDAVHRSPELQEKLRAGGDAVALGQEHGYHFTDADVDAAIAELGDDALDFVTGGGKGDDSGGSSSGGSGSSGSKGNSGDSGSSSGSSTRSGPKGSTAKRWARYRKIFGGI